MQQVDDIIALSSTACYIYIFDGSLLNQHLKRVFRNFDIRLQNVDQPPAIFELENMVEVRPAEVSIDEEDAPLRLSQRNGQI